MSREKLEQVKRKWEEKLAHYEHELAITSGVEKKFELRERIQECEQEIERIKKKINYSKVDSEIRKNEQNTQLKSSNQNRSMVVNNQTNSKKDVFICHASEDKQDVVDPLIHAFRAANITYWYDQVEIQWGDSITKKVNEGLSESRFFIVVLSETFLAKKWAQRELSATLNTEASSGEVKILPLVTATDNEQRQSIFEQLPLLNDKLYLIWEDNPDQIAKALKLRLATPKI